MVYWFHVELPADLPNTKENRDMLVKMIRIASANEPKYIDWRIKCFLEDHERDYITTIRSLPHQLYLAEQHVGYEKHEVVYKRALARLRQLQAISPLFKDCTAQGYYEY